jgi:hypothetical protein
MPGVFPDYPAVVIRNSGGERNMAAGHQHPQHASPHWRGWLKPENRCLVPANRFAEYAPEPNPETKKTDVVWFALNNDRPLFAFAGIWMTFNGDPRMRPASSFPIQRNGEQWFTAKVRRPTRAVGWHRPEVRVGCLFVLVVD